MKKTILLVEDDAVVRDMIRGALDREYNVLEASNYSRAIEQRSYPIDLAIIDYHLPDRDGFEVLKVVREARPAIPAIIITAYSRESLAIEAIKAGVTDYIKKPLSIMYLIERVSEILGIQNDEGDPEIEHVESRDEFIMDCVAMYIEKNFMKELKLEDLAAKAGMNKSKFCKAFKNRFGICFKSYLNRLRVNDAALLLKNSGLNITEIAFFVGYGSVEYFDRVFSTIYGVSPREYRKGIHRKIDNSQVSTSTS